MALFGYGLLSLVVASLFVVSRANVLPAHRVGFFRAHLIQRAPLNETWGQYSPYFPSGSYSAPPDGCEVDQVSSIQRHGARYPTGGATERIQAALAQFANVTEYNDKKIAFVADYEYDLGVSHLIAFGARQSYEAGEEVYERYSDLVSNGSIPFVRASGSERVIDTATNWTAGFSAASNGAYNPVLNLIISEELNDTLDDAMCPNVGDSDAQTDEWTTIYAAPIAERLNNNAVGANLSTTNVYNLMSLCPFDTLANETPSPFCDLFTEDEFDGFAYVGDLDKYYGTGYGQELGPVQGVGYINELIARLTGQPVQDSTQTNHTLDSSNDTFPLDRTVYADFSHDNQMVAIYSAMGLFTQAAALDPSNPDPARTWRASNLVPFSARMVTERLSCDGEAYVRVLVNDALQPLEFCGNGDGRCTLDAFVESQSYARNNGNGDFDKCGWVEPEGTSA
ncbi:histidine phosphatase superfamily [Schizophyllum commune]